ncbi:MAG: DUF6428 family protein [Verrucomicrobiales bacterium]
MTFAELKQSLQANPECSLEMVFEGGSAIPPHFHVTEVGHVTKDFIDCGGTRRTTSSCVLQTLVAHDVDHRLSSTKLASILNLTGTVLPNDELPVEVEYDQGTVAIFALNDIRVDSGIIHLILGAKHTACLAPDKCGLDNAPSATTAATTASVLNIMPDPACDPAANC